ncbi:MAG: TonB-dependent receptor domain-containing protein [Alistipes shahii]
MPPSAHGTYSLTASYSYRGNVGAMQSAIPNPGLTWERTYMTNVGLSIGLYKRVMVDVEFYNNLTTDMLTQSRVSSIISEDAVMRNVGKMRNRGYEIVITSANIVHKDFSLADRTEHRPQPEQDPVPVRRHHPKFRGARLERGPRQKRMVPDTLGRYRPGRRTAHVV